jgi:hypothetical protein
MVRVPLELADGMLKHLVFGLPLQHSRPFHFSGRAGRKRHARTLRYEGVDECGDTKIAYK